MKAHATKWIIFLILLSTLVSMSVSATRLPTIGGDDGTWGSVLNTYLNVSHNGSGELHENIISSIHIVNGTITDADISNTTNLTIGDTITFTLGEIIDNIVSGWITITGNLNVTQNISANWLVGNINWSNIQNTPELVGNNTDGWNVTFIDVRSDNWTNVTITESQIRDLQPYISNGSSINVLDINASSSTIHGNLNVTGTSYLGDITITSNNITTNEIISRDGNISFYNTSGNEQIRITHDGKIGVGTTNPLANLEVVGDIVSKGTSWTSRNNGVDNNWRDVVYGNGMFVAVSDSGTNDKVITSPDGINWTARESSANIEGITYHNGLFVAVGTNIVATSADGITWTNRTSAANSNWWDVTYGNGVFVAIARTGTPKVMTSPDGITWTNRSSASLNNWVSIAYGNNLFVAVSDIKQGESVDYGIMTSPDGITWSNQTVASLTYGGVTYGNGIFVAVANSGTGNRVVTSSDGITWTNRTTPVDNDWMDVTYGNGLFVAVAETGSGDRVMTSTDGINWVTRTSAADNTWEDITYGNGVFVAVADSGTGNRIMTSGKTEFNELSDDNVYFGAIELRGNLNVTGTSYLGDVTITSDNITTNGIISRDGNISFYNTSGNEQIRITPAGKIGIGITDPSERVNVSGNIGANGNITAEYFFGNGSQLTSLTESQITDLLHNVNGTNINVLDVNASSATINGNLNVTGTSFLGDITITSDNITTNGVISKEGNISFFNSSGNEQIRITHDGKIGIGNSNPLATLHVQGPDIDTPASELSNNLSIYVGSGSGAAVGIGYNSTSHSYIQAYGNKPLIINEAGNFLGIGALSVPFGPMHIVIPNNAIGMYIENSGGTTNKREFSIYGDTQTLAIGSYNDVGTFIRSLIQFDHDGGITLPSLGSVTDVRTVCATAAGELELKDGSCSGSSRRYKENEKALEYGIDELMLLEPKWFNYKTHSNVTGDLEYLGSRTKRRIGLMAEDVYEILPEVVVVEEGIIDSIDYANLIPLTIKVLQEQQKRIDRIDSQKGNYATINFSLQDSNNTPANIPRRLSILEVSNTTTLFDVVIQGATRLKETLFTKPVYFSEDTVGQALILTGDTQVQIYFETSYEQTPLVTITPLEFIDGPYKVSDKTPHGFTIIVQQPQNNDIAFDWHAFGSATPIIATTSASTRGTNANEGELTKKISTTINASTKDEHTIDILTTPIVSNENELLTPDVEDITIAEIQEIRDEIILQNDSMEETPIEANLSEERRSVVNGT